MTDSRRPYFAYGSNMASENVGKYCASPTILGVVAVPGYQFRIAKHGYGTMVEDTDAEIHGLLWSLTDDDLRSLDEYEGLGDGHYYRASILVLFEGNSIEAQVYLATDPAPGKARAGYLDQVVEAARELALPREYISMLERLA